MKRINIDNQQTHFIGSWNIENNNLCKSIIDFFLENKDLQIQGMTAGGTNTEIKKTTDIPIKPNDLSLPKFINIKSYIDELYKCFIDYQNQWQFLRELIKDVDIGTFNIQRYNPGDHFARIHTERTSLDTLHRVFAWMTYLDNVDDGGETVFTNYNIKIKPEMGKTLIWPAEWTHAHKGEILKSGVKHIVTGWMYFPYSEK